MSKNKIERFLLKISISNDNFYNGTPCLEWTAHISPNGYGRFQLNRKSEYAHRVAYELIKGKIPENLVINHLCRNRKCCNPDHLEVITQKLNIQKGKTGYHDNHLNKFKTHCPQGHEYNKENTYAYNGNRVCKICTQIRSHQQYQRKKLEMKNLV